MVDLRSYWFINGDVLNSRSVDVLLMMGGVLGTTDGSGKNCHSL